VLCKFSLGLSVFGAKPPGAHWNGCLFVIAGRAAFWILRHEKAKVLHVRGITKSVTKTDNGRAGVVWKLGLIFFLFCYLLA